MAGLKMIVTKAGRAALVNAQHSGTKTVTVVAAGVTAQEFTPVAEMTSLPGESKRLATLSGGSTAPDTIHGTIRDDSDDHYDVRGVGLYLDDGTLFALYGQEHILIQKSSEASLLLAMDVQFADIDATQLIFGDTNFQLNLATEQTPGVVQLATVQDVLTGQEGNSVITLTTLLKALLAHPRYTPGQIVWTAGRRPFSGTLLCDGSAVSRTQYPALFDEIGTTYGVGDGSTTFNLPNLIDDVTIVHTNDASKVGSFTDGSIITHAHTATSGAVPDHRHNITVSAGGDHGHNASTNSAGDHVHATWADAQGAHMHSGSTSASGDHAHTQAGGTMYLADYGGQIKGGSGHDQHTNADGRATAGGGNHAHTFGTDWQGTHGHNIAMNGAGGHAHSVSVANGGNHAHTADLQAAGGHLHAITVDATGNQYNLAAGVRMLACIAY